MGKQDYNVVRLERFIAYNPEHPYVRFIEQYIQTYSSKYENILAVDKAKWKKGLKEFFPEDAKKVIKFITEELLTEEPPCPPKNTKKP